MVVADPNSPYAPAPAHALVVCAEASVADLNGELETLGYRVTIAAEPYQAFVELLERPLVYDAVVLSLPTLYREELKLIRTVRDRLNHLDVFITHTDGRHGALAEAMRLGATGLLGPEGIHRLATVGEAPAAATERPANEDASGPADRIGNEGREIVQSRFAATNGRNEPSTPASVSREADEASAGIDEVEADANGPLLTADELRALLQEQPTLPPG